MTSRMEQQFFTRHNLRWNTYLASLVSLECRHHFNWGKSQVGRTSIIIHFAADCRVDLGYRLLMHCIQHVFDSRTKSLGNKTAKLIVHQGEVGIHLLSEIPTSMKSSVYCSKIAATPTKILCCKCSCHCGGQGNKRILCVHNLPLLFLLTTLLFDALADNLLCDFAACLR